MSKDKGKGKPGKGDQNDDVLEGTPRSDLLLGKKGGDILIGKGGDDLLIGGKGIDTALYSGSFLDYKILTLGPVAIVHDLRGRSPDGTDMLLQIEQVQFADYTLFLDGRNNAPYAVADRAETTEDDAIVISRAQILANDRDPDGNALSIVDVRLVSGAGAVTLVKGNVAYDPGAAYQHLDAGETATVVLEYKVTDGRGAFDTAHITVTIRGVDDAPANQAPVAVDDAFGMQEDGVLFGGVLGNDSDADLDGLAAILDTGPQNGTLTLGADGTFTYTPNADFAGEDSFTYHASDGAADSNPATVTIQVAAVNDAPVAADQAFTETEDGTVTGSLADSTSDVDDSQLEYRIVGASKPVFKLGADGSFEIDLRALGFDRLDDGETDTLSFDYVASDGEADSNVATVTITVTGVNDAPGTADAVFSTDEDSPIALSVAVEDPDDAPEELSYSLLGGAPAGLTFNPDGSFSFDPRGHHEDLDTGDVRPVSFQYTASDGEATGAASTVTVNVSGVNDAPVTASQAFTSDEDGTVSGSLAALTTDADDSSFDFQIVGASKPKLKLGADGSFEIDLQALGYDRLDDGESESFSFDFIANDGEADSNVSTVSVTVTGLNDAPSTTPDHAVAVEDDPAVTGNVLENDEDLDASDELSVVPGEHTLAHGTLQLLNSLGDYSYVVTDQGLAAGEEATDVFQYTVSDGTVSVTESLGIVVTGVNDAPIAGDDTLQGPLGSTGPVAIAAADLLANDHDVDRGTTLEVSSVLGVSELGAVVTLSGGEITYDASGVAILDAVPTGGVMADWFEYTVADGDGGFDTARVDLSVSGRMTVANNAPVAGHEGFSSNAMYAADGSIIPMEIPIALLLRNDVDPDGDPLTITGIAHSSGGTFEIVGDHILFTPTPSTGIGPVPTTVAESEPNDDFPVADFIPRIWFGPDGGGMARASYTGFADGPDLVQFELRAGETLTVRLEETANFAFLGVTDHNNSFVAFSEGADIVYTAMRDGVHGAFVDGAGSYEISLSFNPVERAQHANFAYVVSDGRGGEGFGGVSLSPVFTVPGQPLQAFSPLFNEWLLGGDLSDELVGYNGDDTMTGGGGADRFVHRSTDGRDIVTDFTPGFGGDRLAVLETTFGLSSSNVADFVRVEESGSFFGPGSVVSVDHDGAGPAFYEQAFFLEGVTGLSASDLYASGNLVFA